MLWVPSFSLWCMRLLHDLLQQATDQYQFYTAGPVTPRPQTSTQFCTAGPVGTRLHSRGDWQASKWSLICIYSHSASFTLLPELCIPSTKSINVCTWIIPTPPPALHCLAWKLVFHGINPWYQNDWGLIPYNIIYSSSVHPGLLSSRGKKPFILFLSFLLISFKNYDCGFTNI